MNIKRTLCVLLAAALIFCVSCGEQKDNVSSVPSGNAVENTTAKSFCLLYCESDSINPYKAVSKYNRQLASLMYDPLVKLDPLFQPVYVLAENIEYEGKKCIVTLKDAVFSDGSPVTADDVVYSEKLAKDSDTLYASELGEIRECTADGGKTVVFTLKKADPYFANLLDFPIIKSGSEKLKDENKILLPPIGSGRYVFDTATATLKVNEKYGGELPGIKTVGLISAPDSEVSEYNIEAGNVSIVPTDLSDGAVPSVTGTAVRMNLNNIVYLGVNTVYGKMANVISRYAVSAALNREEICTAAYYSYALPANGLFHPLWKDSEGLQNISSAADQQNLVAYLEELGYNDKNTDGYYVNGSGKKFSLSLVYNEGNDRHASIAAAVKEQLEAAGIAVSVKPLSKAKYTEALNYGNYDLYVAEVKLFNNMDVSELVTSGGSLAYGLRSSPKVPEPSVPDDTDEEAPEKTADSQDGGEKPKEEQKKTAEKKTSAGISLDKAVSGFYSEKLSLTDIINAFNDEMPIIPVCYRCGVTVCDTKLGVTSISSVNDPFFGMEKIK